MIPLTIAYILNIIDYAFSTYWVNKYGIEAEANPLGRWLYDNNVAWLAKIIIIGGLFAILGCFIKKCPKVAWVSYILLAVYALIVVYHIVIFIYVLTI